VALAVHIAGSKPAFVELMNERAQEIGMKHTHFASPHGLPPARGQQPDVTTARDMSLLARVLLKHPTALRYTSTHQHSIRNGRFMMRSHNHLLNTFRGCDGLKTGYTYAGGYSIAGDGGTRRDPCRRRRPQQRLDPHSRSQSRRAARPRPSPCTVHGGRCRRRAAAGGRAGGTLATPLASPLWPKSARSPGRESAAAG
jgi:hypothetical protein